MKRQFVTDINMIKYEVCVEVAKQAFAGELRPAGMRSPIRSSPEIIPDGGAAFTGSGRSCASGLIWRRDAGCRDKVQ